MVAAYRGSFVCQAETQLALARRDDHWFRWLQHQKRNVNGCFLLVKETNHWPPRLESSGSAHKRQEAVDVADSCVRKRGGAAAEAARVWGSQVSCCIIKPDSVTCDKSVLLTVRGSAGGGMA